MWIVRFALRRPYTVAVMAPLTSGSVSEQQADNVETKAKVAEETAASLKAQMDYLIVRSPSEFIGVGKSYHAGWPGGHCLRVPKEQEGLFYRRWPLHKRLVNGIAGRKSPLVATRPGRSGVRATQPRLIPPQ